MMKKREQWEGDATMKYLDTRFILVMVEAFVALTSLVCGVGLAVGVIQFPLTFLQGTPFSDWVIPGLTMAIIVGGSALLAAALLLTGSRLGILASALAGLILLGFEGVEVLGIDRNTGYLFPLVITLQSAYTVFSLTMLGGAAFLWRQERRRRPAHIKRVTYG